MVTQAKLQGISPAGFATLLTSSRQPSEELVASSFTVVTGSAGEVWLWTRTVSLTPKAGEGYKGSPVKEVCQLGNEQLTMSLVPRCKTSEKLPQNQLLY